MRITCVNDSVKDIDTIVCFTKYDTAPVFTCAELQSEYERLYGGDSKNLKAGEFRVDRVFFGNTYINLLIVGFDCKKKNVYDFFKKVVIKIGRKLDEMKSKKIIFDNLTSLIFTDDKEEIIRQFAMTMPLVDYRFNKYITRKDKEIEEKEIYILGDYEAALKEGLNIAEGIMIARDLTNEPANILTPEELSKRAIQLGEESGFEVEVFSKEKCEELNMESFLTVARASENEPKLIVMRYKGSENDDNIKGLIGKGLCYDSGGLFLKPGKSMETMSGDMAGSASVIGAMYAIAKNNLNINVTAVVAACENLIDGKGYRNGDIIKTMSGKTVLIGSTDAEGRLTLADAITYIIQNENVNSILELSTLTGSSANFFSNVCSSVYTTNDKFYEKLEEISEISCEKYFRLPVFDEYKKFIKVETADLYNTSKNGAGAITAGMFLDEFSETTPFAHMDIAGVSSSMVKKDSLASGATGYGVKTVYNYIKSDCR